MRKRRLKINGRASYHVSTRTVLGSFLFEQPETREWIYNQVLFLASCFYVELHAVVILSNHYHLVFTMDKPKLNEHDIKLRYLKLQSKNRIPKQWLEEHLLWFERLTDLSEFIKILNQSIAQRINRNQNNKGHVWGQRYFSSLLENGQAMQTCLAYVELNPVRAGICKKPSQYPWCSAGRSERSEIQLPRLTKLKGIRKRHRKDAFYDYLDQVALIESGELNSKLTIPNRNDVNFEFAEIKILLEMCFKRTNWATSSLILGSSDFCKKAMIAFRLNKKSSPSSFPIGAGIFNEKKRVGPFLF